ncbi:hypothetical protein ACFQI3_07620 [Hansschlegelia quercus]|uniref:Uncharacterized protein n=1 Tax=Hansschlegelia quercus TaxID=2528245 RepID=A0A4Q9GHG2_9HYPH|nr:hypothetical protein [Hansschlegelia quercus]TBN53593.1 hypothetical protein EYR15_07210 [Hansschlegelia quercus]
MTRSLIFRGFSPSRAHGSMPIGGAPNSRNAFRPRRLPSLLFDRRLLRASSRSSLGLGLFPSTNTVVNFMPDHLAGVRTKTWLEAHGRPAAALGAPFVRIVRAG